MYSIINDFEEQLAAGNEILVAFDWQRNILSAYFKEHFVWPSYGEPLIIYSDQLKYKGRPIVSME